MNADFRGGKHDVWDGGFRTPFFVRWPGKATAGAVSHATVSVVDILSTVAEVVNEPLPPVATGAEDSRSFLPVILGDESAKGRHDMISHSADGTFALRKGPWKWIEGVPVEFTDGTVDFEVRFHGANRISLRLEHPGGSCRLVISRTLASLAKNPSKGDGQASTVEIAERKLKLEPDQWYPVRLSLSGQAATIRINDVSFKGSHAALSEQRTALSFLVFGDSAGFRNVASHSRT